MKIVLIFALCIAVCSCSSKEVILQVPANQVVELDYPGYDVFSANIKNGGLKGIEVAVLSKEDDRRVRGFGLGTKGDVDVLVEAENKLVFKNDNSSAVSLALKIREESRSVFEREGEYVSFTLRNKSAKSIPLIIPTVMNPNLSPFSRSGVDLKVGQEILFKQKGKEYVLLTVDKSIEEGSEVDVAELLKQRKLEIGLN